MILEQRPGFDMRHTLISEIAMQERAPDILITGHHHIGFGAKGMEAANKRGKMLAINPGALCRLSAHPEEMERQVQVCLLTIRDVERFDIDVNMIPLQSARPGYEVLSREHLEVQSEREYRIAEFLGLLAEEGETKFLETREIIEDVGSREKLPQEVVDEALRRLGVAREQVSA
jgi:exonuclease SbcD